MMVGIWGFFLFRHFFLSKEVISISFTHSFIQVWTHRFFSPILYSLPATVITYFDVQTVPDLASKGSFKLAALSSLHVEKFSWMLRNHGPHFCSRIDLSFC